MERVEIDAEVVNKKYEGFIMDTSSIIYMYKAGILDIFLGHYSVYITEDVFHEIDSQKDFLGDLILEYENVIVEVRGIDGLISDNELSFTDIGILELAIERGFPVFSEDKGIMTFLKEKKMIFFNSLIAVYFLLRDGYINRQESIAKLFQLNRIGWYSESIFRAAFKLIENFKS